MTTLAPSSKLGNEAREEIDALLQALVESGQLQAASSKLLKSGRIQIKLYPYKRKDRK